MIKWWRARKRQREEWARVAVLGALYEYGTRGSLYTITRWTGLSPVRVVISIEQLSSTGQIRSEWISANGSDATKRRRVYWIEAQCSRCRAGTGTDCRHFTAEKIDNLDRRSS